MEVDEMYNEVLRKIGRNILLFQQLEHMLKHLVANGNVAGTFRELKANSDRNRVVIHRKTLGQVATEYADTIIAPLSDESVDVTDVNEPHFSFSFRAGGDKSFQDIRKQTLSLLVCERNELVHHLLPKLDPTSTDSCEAVAQYLDEQRDKVAPEIKNLRAIIDSFEQARKDMAAFLQSEEGKKFFLLPNKEERAITILLQDIASQSSREDGWTYLSTAGIKVNETLVEELEVLRKKYGKNTLKKFIHQSFEFELLEETLTTGGVRYLYRPKEGWQFYYTV